MQPDKSSAKSENRLKFKEIYLKLLLWLVCGVLSFYQFYQLYDVYEKHPIVINTEILSTLKQREVPGCSICYKKLMLIQKDKLKQLFPQLDHVLKEIRYGTLDYETDSVKMNKYWKELVMKLKHYNISSEKIRSTLIQKPIVGCHKLDGEEAVSCETMTDFKVIYDDSIQCYTLFSRSAEERQSRRFLMEIPFKSTRPFLVFYVLLNYSNSVFPPRRAHLIIHSPQANPLNLVASQIELEINNSYEIQYSSAKAILQPEPYQTKCRNYSRDTIWESQQDCFDQCLANRTLDLCKCWPSNLQIKNKSLNDQICWIVNPEENCSRQNEIKCREECRRPDCLQETYEFQIRNVHKRVRKTNDSYIAQLKWNSAKVTVLTPDNYEKIFIFTPKYTVTEMLCYCSSLLGFWYGLSVRSSYNHLSKIIKKMWVKEETIKKVTPSN